MKEKRVEEITEKIKNLNITDELKEELYYLNEKINTIINSINKTNLDIVIDERSQKEIDILLEYTVKIIEDYNIYKETIKFRDDTRIRDIKDSVIVIDDFNIFYEEYIDSWNKEKRLKNIFKDNKNNNNIMIFSCTNKITDNFDGINKSIFNPDICIHLKGKTDTKNLYKELINRFNDENIPYNISYYNFKKIIESMDNKIIKNINVIDYMYDYALKKIIINDNNIVDKKVFDEFIQKEKKTKSKNNINKMIGLNNIKDELDSLYNYLNYCKKYKIKENMYLNLFFLGNPGTGKTTVARMYSEKLYKMGYIDENKLIEVVPNDLIGEYVGQTKEAIRKILNKAKGGVLFIDEAYLLYTNSYSKGNNPYMDEAIVELIKYLEDPKNVVIFAGYPEEMKKLYNANPGIKSRIYKEILFEDYSTIELYQILNNELNKKKLVLDSKSKNKIIDYINILKQDNNFGNARSMLQLSQKMIMTHANNNKDTNVINYHDLPVIDNNKTKMGFGVYD